MKISTKTIVTVGMFTAVLAVLSILTIPMPSGVPLTLQTFAVALCGYTLGWKKGAVTVLLYLLIGALGVPVFAGMKGGVQFLFSYTGGFLWGFVVLSLLCGLGGKKKKQTARILYGIAGLAVCHVVGSMQFSAVASVPVSAAFLTVSLPYLLKDIMFTAGASLVAAKIQKVF